MSTKVASNSNSRGSSRATLSKKDDVFELINVRVQKELEGIYNAYRVAYEVTPAGAKPKNKS